MKKLIVLGDICPSCGFPKDGCTPESLFGDLLPLLKNADYTVANLESPATAYDTKLPKNSICLKAKPEDLTVLAASGIDALSLANNHILDYCEQGLRDTLQKTEELRLAVYGAGSIDNAAKLHTVTVGEKRIGFLAFAEEEFNCAQKNRIGANRWDDLSTPEHIRKAKEKCDYLIIQYHGGIEHYRYPSLRLQKKCRVMADCGANFITCQHSHCIGTRENYQGCEILYGQGNTLFGFIAGKDAWNRGLVAEIVFNSHTEVRYLPITATPDGVRLLNPEEAQTLLQQTETASEALCNSDFLEEQWKRFCAKQKDSYLPLAFGWGRCRNKLNCLLHGGLVRLLTSRRTRRTAMNLLRCDAHREVLQTILEQDTQQ